MAEAVETPVSRIYAQAIVQLGDEHGNLQDIADELESFHEVWKDDEGLRRFLISPAISREQKLELVESVGKRFSDDLRRFLSVLAVKGRIDQFGSIYESFRLLLEKREGVVRAKATFAICMEERVVKQIETELSEKLGRKVLLWVEHDPEILGGLILQVGDRRVDRSLRRELEEFRAASLGVA